MLQHDIGHTEWPLIRVTRLRVHSEEFGGKSEVTLRIARSFAAKRCYQAVPWSKIWKKFAESMFPRPLISFLSTARTVMHLRGSFGSPSMPIR
jgi:hypothetical protein